MPDQERINILCNMETVYYSIYKLLLLITITHNVESVEVILCNLE